MSLLIFLFGTQKSNKGFSTNRKKAIITGKPIAVSKASEQKHKAEKNRKLKGTDLESMGVNLKQFTPAKLRKDALRIVNEFGSFKIDLKTKQAGYLIDPSNLTRTGKVPKCIVNARIHYDLPGEKMLACHGMKYTADGRLYSIDFNEWENHTTTAYSVRERDGKMVLTYKSVEDANTGYVKVLYREEQ